MKIQTFKHRRPEEQVGLQHKDVIRQLNEFLGRHSLNAVEEVNRGKT